jgi:hypothetical protein
MDEEPDALGGSGPSTAATCRAIQDVLTHGLRGDLARSAVGVELGQMLQSGLTSDIADGAAPGDLLVAIREACGQNAVAYARLLELAVLASLDELQVIAGLSDGDLLEPAHELPPPPPRRVARRRR